MVSRKYTNWRRRARHARLIFLVIVLIILGIGLKLVFSLLFIPKTPVMSVAIAGDPISIVYLDQEGKQATVLSLPAHTYTRGTAQVGLYSVEALWRLGDIDKRYQSLLETSLEDTFGAPIFYYIGPAEESSRPLFTSGDNIIYKIFSFSQAFSFIKGLYRTNMDITTYLSVTLALRSITSDKIKNIDLTNMPVFTPTTLPDGTVVKIVDADKLDAFLSHVFEIEAIRRDLVRVALYNTTPTAQLGSKVGRLLNNVGALVVEVGNEEGSFERCQVIGTKKWLSSKTASFIHSYFDCDLLETSTSDRADLILKIGTLYEQKFLPRK